VRRNLSLASALAGSRGHLCIGQEFFNSCLNACRVGLESLFQLRNCLCGSGLAILCCWNIFRTLHFNAQRALAFGMAPTHRSWFESIHPHDMPPLPLCRHQLSPIAPGDIAATVESNNNIQLKFQTDGFVGEYFHYTGDLFLIYKSGHLARLTCKGI
jgi:hypothetical protein